MIKYFIDRGGEEVLWVDPYPSRLPQITDLKRSRSLHEQGTACDSRIKIVDFPVLPIEPLGGFPLNLKLFGRKPLEEITNFVQGGNVILGIGKPSMLATYIMKNFSFEWCFYDAMDDFPEFHNGLSGRKMASNERHLSTGVKSIFVSSSGLLDKFHKIGHPGQLILNAFCPDTIPFVKRGMKKPPFIFGYVGSMGDWFDWTVVRALAEQIGENEIHLIGPLLKPLPQNLPPNIKVFPPCSHDKVMVHYKTFRVGLIPFKVNSLTRCVDPIKFYEYYAMGLPVMTTDFGEMSLRKTLPGVYAIDDDPLHMANVVEQVLTYRADDVDVATWREENSWEKRFDRARLFSRFFDNATG